MNDLAVSSILSRECLVGVSDSYSVTAITAAAGSVFVSGCSFECSWCAFVGYSPWAS